MFLIGLFYLLHFIRLSQQDQVAMPRLTKLCKGEMWFWKREKQLADYGRGFNMCMGGVDGGVGVFMVLCKAL